MLCAAPFVDELFAGVPTLGAADIRASFDVSYGALAAILLSAPLLLAILIESPLLLLARRIGRRRMTAAGFAIMALSALAAAAAGNGWQLAVCLACSAAASGVALALVETAIMDAAPDQREIWMTRWTLGGAVGDLAAPALIALAAHAGFGWRGAFVAAALLAAFAALALPPHIRAVEDGDDEPRVGAIAALRRALGNRGLLVWCGAATVCDLLDEILVVVAVLFLREMRGMDSAGAAFAIAAVPAAGALGLLVTERVLGRVAPLRYLAACCLVCTVAIGAFVCFDGVTAAVVLLGMIGFTAASMWPIATARSYRALPEDSTAVAAVHGLFTPLSVALPVAVAAAADQWGLTAAVLLLTLQPLTLLAVAVHEGEDTRSPWSHSHRETGGARSS